MRPWLHIPVLIFLGTLVLGLWVAFRDVPLERRSDRTVFAAPLDKLPPPAPQGVLSGWLVDENGQILADSDLSTQQAGRVLWARSEADGRFELRGLFDGPLKVTVLAPGRLPEILALPAPRLGIRLALTKSPVGAPAIPELARSNWGGRLRNPLDINSVQGYEVWLVPIGAADDITSGVPRRVTTASDGSFLIPDLIHAPYGVHVIARDHEGALEPNLLVPWGQAAPRLDHGSGPPTDAWTLAAGELHGVLRSEGSPVRSALVMLEALVKSDTEDAQSRVLPAVQTDEQGRWSFPDLPPARYQIRIRGGGLRWEQEVQLDAGQKLEVKF